MKGIINMGYQNRTLQKIQKIQLNAYRKLSKSISEENEDVFDHVVSDAMLDIGNTDAVSFYVKKDDVLEFKLIKTKSMNFSVGGIKENITFPPIQLFNKEGEPNYSTIVSYSVC